MTTTLPPNRVRAALRAGKTVFGSEISRFRAPDIARIYAQAGFDFVFLDMEHSSFALETIADMIQAARGAGVVPIVRVPQAEYAFVARALDCGARGVIVPRVNTAQQVQEIISWMRYPPLGIRGFACTRAQTDGQSISPSEFINAAHRETLCVIQIERRQALDNLEAMLAIDGVDVACLGYMDLSVDLGIPGELDHPQMVGAIDRLIAAAQRAGIAAGIICPQFEAIAHWAARGMRFISYSTDELLLQEAATAAVRRFQSLPRSTNTPGISDGHLQRGRA